MRKNQAVALVNSSANQLEGQFESHSSIQGQGSIQGQSQDFMAAFAQQFADRCAAILLARLPKPQVIQARYLTVQQAAVYISHTKKSFEYLMSKKLFPVIREDRLVLIDREDLDKWMARHKC